MGRGSSMPWTDRTHLGRDVLFLYMFRVCGQDTRQVSGLVDSKLLHVDSRRVSVVVGTGSQQNLTRSAWEQRRNGTGEGGACSQTRHRRVQSRRPIRRPLLTTFHLTVPWKTSVVLRPQLETRDERNHNLPRCEVRLQAAGHSSIP